MLDANAGGGPGVRGLAPAGERTPPRDSATHDGSCV